MDYQRLLNHVHPEEFDPTYKTLPRFVPVLERGANVLGSQANTLALPSCQCILGNFCPQAELQLVSLHRGWCLSRKSGLPFFVTLNTVRKSVLHHNTRISTSSHMSYHWLQQLSPIPNKRADLCCFVCLFLFLLLVVFLVLAFILSHVFPCIYRHTVIQFSETLSQHLGAGFWFYTE